MKKAARFGSQRLGFVLAALLVGCSGSAPTPSTSDGTGSPAASATAVAVQAATPVSKRVSFGDMKGQTEMFPITPLLKERLSRGLGVTDNEVVVDVQASGRR